MERFGVAVTAAIPELERAANLLKEHLETQHILAESPHESVLVHLTEGPHAVIAHDWRLRRAARLVARLSGFDYGGGVLAGDSRHRIEIQLYNVDDSELAMMRKVAWGLFVWTAWHFPDHPRIVPADDGAAMLPDRAEPPPTPIAEPSPAILTPAPPMVHTAMATLPLPSPHRIPSSMTAVPPAAKPVGARRGG